MGDERFEALMKAWGRAYWQETYDPDRHHRQRLSHPIAQSMEFAPGRRSAQKIRKIIGRDGTTRRQIMARSVGIEGFTIIPSGFVDPVKGKETRKFGGLGGAAVPAELQRVEAAVKELEGFNFLRGTCIRVNYCTEGQHADKALVVTERMRRVSKFHKVVSVDMLRDELLYGRIWIHGRVYSPAPPRIVAS